MSENANGKPITTPPPPSSTPITDASGSPHTKPAAGNAAPKGNPAFRALGLPNFRLRLPSRNWMIFLTVVGSWTGTLVYDRRQKKKVQQKWCSLVEHIAEEPLPIDSMARKMTIILSAAPGDGLRASREHFNEYVKPVLVAAAMDWDVVEGRKEGDVRVGVAEKVRRLRRRKGEVSEIPLEVDKAMIIEESRDRRGISEYEGIQGDIVIGRNTWREYVRGLHEGWLGSIDPPKTKAKSESATSEEADSGLGTLEETASPESTNASLIPSDVADEAPPGTNDEAKGETNPETKPEEKPKEPEKEKPSIKESHIPASLQSYASSTLPPTIPQELGPSAAIPFPHVLGFLKTPIRMYRFLNRRKLADDVGRQVAAAVLASHRSFHEDSGVRIEGEATLVGTSEFASEAQTNNGEWNDGTSTNGGASASASANTKWEQTTVLIHEEDEWTKTAKQRKPDEDIEKKREREWIDPIIIDPRIGRRMRFFELERAEEDRAKEIAKKGQKGKPNISEVERE